MCIQYNYFGVLVNFHNLVWFLNSELTHVQRPSRRLHFFLFIHYTNSKFKHNILIKINCFVTMHHVLLNKAVIRNEFHFFCVIRYQAANTEPVTKFFFSKFRASR